jgi:hypothetical protein
MKLALGTTIVTNGQLIDGTGAPPIRDAALEDLDIEYPVEYITLLGASNAKLALECGYTTPRSGGSLLKPLAV